MINSNCALIEKRPQYTQRHDQVILQVDSASPHTANPGREVLKSLGLGNFIARAPLYRPGSIRLSHRWGTRLQSNTSPSSEKPKNGSMNGLGVETVLLEPNPLFA